MIARFCKDKSFGNAEHWLYFLALEEKPGSIQVQHEANQGWEAKKNTDVRGVAKRSLLQILEPLAAFGSDLGFSVGELQAIFREAAVMSAAARQREVADRVNISGIAATTGIPRSEISRILKVAVPTFDRMEKANEGQQQSTNRILAAWHEDPAFTGPNGEPADLRMYGRGVTFETLAKRYGRGIPTRAVLDELFRAGAIELLATQKLRAKASMTVDRGVSARAIKTFGDRVSELLSTMLVNMRKPEIPRFIASVSHSAVLISSLPLLKKELSVKGADFLADIQESMSRKPRSRSPKRRNEHAASVSVTIFYHESSELREGKLAAASKRRNFRRES